MKKSTLLTVSLDEEYIANIEGTLSEQLADGIRLEFISDSEYLDTYLATPHKVDVLIIDEKLKERLSNNLLCARAILVTEKDAFGKDYVNKYDGAQGILRLLGAEYIRKESGDARAKTVIHNVIAACDCEAKTRISLALAWQLADFGRKVLYISARNVQDFYYELFPGRGDQDLYFAKEAEALMLSDRERLSTSEIAPSVVKGKFDYYPQFNRILSAYGIDASRISKVADVMKDTGIYDDIILELPSELDSEVVARLERSHSVVVIASDNAKSAHNLKMLFDSTRDIASKSVVVELGEKGNPEMEAYIIEKGSVICERVATDLKDFVFAEGIDNRYMKDTAEAVMDF